MDFPDSFKTGIDEIDDQHRVLFDSLARLERAVSLKERWSVLHYALIELSDFTRVHFAVEESLMRLHDFPGREAHVAEHRQFVRDLEAIKEKSIRADVTEEMIQLIRKWLVEHVGKTDQAYVPYLRSAPAVAGGSEDAKAGVS